jgi:hypothetical protein
MIWGWGRVHALGPRSYLRKQAIVRDKARRQATIKSGCLVLLDSVSYIHYDCNRLKEFLRPLAANELPPQERRI